MPKGILGRKMGMTQVFEENGTAVPVTVIKAGPCVVVQKKTADADGYNALQLGFEELKEKKANKPLSGYFAKFKVKPLRVLRELRLQADEIPNYESGQEIKANIFSPGEHVDVKGTSKGKGFAGGIKRHGFHRGPMAHGSKYHRRPGSLGAKGPARVYKGRKLPGRMGSKTTTVQNLRVVKVDPENNLIMIKGAVPGPQKGILIIQSSQR